MERREAEGQTLYTIPTSLRDTSAYISTKDHLSTGMKSITYENTKRYPDNPAKITTCNLETCPKIPTKLSGNNLFLNPAIIPLRNLPFPSPFFPNPNILTATRAKRIPPITAHKMKVYNILTSCIQYTASRYSQLPASLVHGKIRLPYPQWYMV